MHPDLEWFQRKWGMPESSPAANAILHLLEMERNGSTASVLTANYEWGDAATDAQEEGTSPLVIVHHEGVPFLQSRRLFESERFVARRLLDLAGSMLSKTYAHEVFEKLFSDSTPSDLQVEAVKAVTQRCLTIITGGPGTGKTYTLARILAFLVQEGVRADFIRLAAPTGKAADRMKKAVTDSVAPDLHEVAESSSTLHSLLGYNPDSGCFRYNSRNPLHCEVLIVDECSMIDLQLWSAVLAALPPAARLILLGDPNQLESVGQGNVFGEMARVAGDVHSPLHATRVHLTQARRFHNRPGILNFAQALEQGLPDEAVRLLEGNDPASGLTWMATGEERWSFSKFPEPIQKALSAIAHAENPESAMVAVQRVCILTAQREYFVGALSMSAVIEEYFATQVSKVRNHPIIINRNDPETGLRNGALGVIHVDADGGRKAWFPNVNGHLRNFSVARLPDFSPAWAITIHRSQGSEYDEVLVILPREESPLATRELLYTAITRARSNVTIAGDISSVRKAIATPSSRTTLLAAALR